ncbi:MAG: amidohydrolase family protein [Acidimicrobiales bacterium]
MAIIDSQVHAYERDHPGRPWARHLHGPPEVTGDQMAAAMDEVGVDGALLVSPYTLYRYDYSYAVEVQAKHPGRFGLITPLDTRRDDVADAVAAWAAQPGAVGVRVMMWGDTGRSGEDPGVNRAIAAAAAHRLPVCLMAWGRLDVAGELARRHPDAQLVIDHLGLPQPFEPPPPPEPFAALADVLALAQHPNVAIKVSGACTLSHQPFPFADLRAPLERIFEAFGFERCLWGTDWTRATALVTYAQAVDAFRDPAWLSPGDRETLMGGALSRVFAWSPTR